MLHVGCRYLSESIGYTYVNGDHREHTRVLLGAHLGKYNWSVCSFLPGLYFSLKISTISPRPRRVDNVSQLMNVYSRTSFKLVEARWRYICLWTRASMVEKMACLFGVMSFSAPMLVLCQWNSYGNGTTKFQWKCNDFHSRKCFQNAICKMTPINISLNVYISLPSHWSLL